MIHPVTFAAGPSTAPARPHPEELAQRLQGPRKTARAPAEGSETRVQISNAALESALDLAFAAADGNRDGTVTISEQKTYEVRTVRINVSPPADGRPGPAGSGPIRAYLEVDATLAPSAREL